MQLNVLKLINKCAQKSNALWNIIFCHYNYSFIQNLKSINHIYIRG